LKEHNDRIAAEEAAEKARLANAEAIKKAKKQAKIDRINQMKKDGTYLTPAQQE